jgi:pyruvate formate lyase activating enzyme
MIIGGLQKLSLCDYPSTPAMVVFLQGCNFNCPFCHNRQLLPRAGTHRSLPMDELFDYLELRRRNVSAVVISGGEPTIQTNLVGFIQRIKAMGYKIKLATNGSRPEVRDDLLRHQLLNYIAMDVKGPGQKYDLLAGKRVEHQNIKKSISSIANSGVPHHFRTTHYPALLSEEDLTRIRSSLPKSSKYIVQPYRAVTNDVTT